MATLNLGRIKPVFRGAYAGGTAYVIDDIVTSGGSSYICILASTGNATSNATYWTQMASGGTDLTSTLTTQGDVVYRNASGLARLGFGTSGHVLTTKGTGANPVWEAASGGKVLQVVSVVKTDTFSSSTAGAFTDITGMSAAITPSATNSKILILGNINSDADQNAHIKLLRDSTAICVGASSSGRSQVTGAAARNVGTGGSMVNNGISFLDSPSSTAALTYKFQFYLWSSTTFYLNRSLNDTDAAHGGRSASTITLMEIGA